MGRDKGRAGAGAISLPKKDQENRAERNAPRINDIIKYSEKCALEFASSLFHFEPSCSTTVN